MLFKFDFSNVKTNIKYAINVSFVEFKQKLKENNIKRYKIAEVSEDWCIVIVNE